MRKLWILGVIGTLALLPFAAFADTGGSATATLTFDSVISTEVVDNWDPMTIEQADIVGLAGATSVVWEADDNGGNTIGVTVYALTDYHVFGAYKEAADKVTDNGFLILTEGGTTKLLNNLGAMTFTDVRSHGKSYNDLNGVLTELWNGGPNISGSGDTHTYTVNWNPGLLPELDVNDALNLTIYILVTEEGT